MKTQLIAVAIALIAFTNIGTAQEVAKPKKVNPAKPALHRPPPPPPAFVPPVIVKDDTKIKRVQPVPPVASISEIGEVAPPPPPPLAPAKFVKISIKGAPTPPSKRKN